MERGQFITKTGITYDYKPKDCACQDCPYFLNAVRGAIADPYEDKRCKMRDGTVIIAGNQSNVQHHPCEVVVKADPNRKVLIVQNSCHIMDKYPDL